VSAKWPLDVFIVAIDVSGDHLAANLMAALRRQYAVTFRGVGGPAMAAEGLSSLFPPGDLPTIGFISVLVELPKILRRLRETADAIVLSPPDLLVLVDSPDFTHRLAARVRRKLPRLPIVKYVAPTVWAWRPGRARAMRPAFDHVLALYPFEPQVMAELGGPPTTYVGHPLLERLAELRPSPVEAAAREQGPPLILLLPGSRRHEVGRLAPVFGAAAAKIAAARPDAEFVVATLPKLAAEIEPMLAAFAKRPRVVTSEADKFAVFRRARAALAASGTVTLELALAGVPMVAGYRVPLVEEMIARVLLSIRMATLPNLLLGERVLPELLQRDCTAGTLAAALLPLLDSGPTRMRQTEAFRRLDRVLETGGEPPSARAARVLLEIAAADRGASAMASGALGQ
jgi:lipid-A-disaccharide synthase